MLVREYVTSGPQRVKAEEVRQHHVQQREYNEHCHWTSSTVEVVVQQLSVSLKGELSSADGLVE